MANPCYYHPKTDAVGSCIQCGTPGCAACLETVGQKMACRLCVGVLKSKPAVTSAAPPPVRQASANPNAGLNYASHPSEYRDTTPAEKLTPARLLKGIGLASLVGLLGSIGIEKILFSIHFNIAILYLLLGLAISGSLRAFTQRGGQAMALTAAGIMLVCLGIGHLLLVQDILNQMRANGDSGAGTPFFDLFSSVMSQLSFAHWMFAAGGVMLCLLTSNRESKPGF